MTLSPESFASISGLRQLVSNCWRPGRQEEPCGALADVWRDRAAQLPDEHHGLNAPAVAAGSLQLLDPLLELLHVSGRVGKNRPLVHLTDLENNVTKSIKHLLKYYEM